MEASTCCSFGINSMGVYPAQRIKAAHLSRHKALVKKGNISPLKQNKRNGQKHGITGHGLKGVAVPVHVLFTEVTSAPQAKFSNANSQS